ncbi:MAG: 30S ribosomal protein S2 [Verrucomicrobiales bacterium]|jgi:small subunit ribosomal protein S2|nr:30S ribosomal protein S2 [Verrucomicrobiales bacterium]
MAKIDAKTLLEAGVHFGHRTDKWNPKMKPFIYEARSGIHIINLSETARQLDAATSFLKNTAAKGGKVLFVGCKKAAQEAVKEAAGKAAAFHVTERWLGGTLTNLSTIRKSIARMREIDELETSGKMAKLNKQEAAALRREAAKIHKNLDGIKDMTKFPDAIVIVDITREYIAQQEAERLNIPIIAITDTNADPTGIAYPIAGNDDAIRSIRIIVDSLASAIAEGNASGDKGERNEKRGARKPAADRPSGKTETPAVSA